MLNFDTLERNLQYDLLSNDNILVGEVISVKDGVAFVTGLPNKRIGEMAQFYGNSTKTFLTKPLAIKIIRRGMLSAAFKALKEGGKRAIGRGSLPPNVGNKVSTTPHPPSQTNVAPYATFNGCEPDVYPIDPVLSNRNNPPVGQHGIKHVEVHRTTCATNPDCKAQNCGFSQPCDNGGKREAVANLTSGCPISNSGTVANLDEYVNILGKPSPQNIATFDPPHPTNKTPESYLPPGKTVGEATDFLHNPKFPNRMETVVDLTKGL